MSASILCSGGTHVYLTGQAHCQCGQAANGYGLSGPLRPATSGVMSYPWPAGYTPQNYRPPKPDPAPETSLAQLRAALRAGASHLSADGQRAYRDDRGNAEVAHWDGATGMYGSWWAAEAVPAEAVRL